MTPQLPQREMLPQDPAPPPLKEDPDLYPKRPYPLARARGV